MELTPEILARFVGGQAEVQNRNEDYLYRGEIAEINVSREGSDTKLTIRLTWCAQMGDEGWVNETELGYAVTLDSGGLQFYFINEIAQGCIALRCPYTGEYTVLFPADYESKLDPSSVRGLELAAAGNGNEPHDERSDS